MGDIIANSSVQSSNKKSAKKEGDDGFDLNRMTRLEDSTTGYKIELSYTKIGASVTYLPIKNPPPSLAL